MIKQGHSGLFKGTKGDLMYHATKEEQAELNRLYAILQKIRERVYGKPQEVIQNV